jgi:LmbE family N-acetylglucosaminyl deacetylase
MYSGPKTIGDTMITPLCGENEWLDLWSSLPSWSIPQGRPVLVVSPHPDDETLAIGGFLAACCSLGANVTLLAVTDGESAYGYDPSLGEMRWQEQRRAATHLGIPGENIIRMRLPDSGLASHEDDVADGIASLISIETLLVAPWSGDFHPDHTVCGRVAERLCAESKARLLSYFFWTWHTLPVHAVSALPMQKFDLTRDWLDAKLRALAEHGSQLYRKHEPAILNESLLWPARQALEVFLPS